MYILGINAYHADSSACLIRDGEIVAAAEEERFTRIKHCAGFPENAIRYCLREANITIDEIEHIGISKDPKRRILKKILYAFFNFDGNLSAKFIESRLNNYSKINNVISKLEEIFELQKGVLKKVKFHNIEHHLAHASSAFLVSPFDEAAILTIDGFGDFASAMFAYGRDNEIKILNRIEFPHSLGVLYTAISQFLGFNKFGDEGKVMGLAAYGEAKYLDKFRDIISVNNNKYKLNLDYFLHHKGGISEMWKDVPSYGRLWSDKFEEVFGVDRESATVLENRHENIASSLQKTLEEVVFSILNNFHTKYFSDNLCLAGGVALNCVMNGKIKGNTKFKNIFIQPASSDSGTSIGTAFYIYNIILGKKRNYIMDDAYLGPSFKEDEIEDVIKKYNLKYIRSKCIFKETAKLISEGNILGLFQGRMEIGPRALGNRSILADPRKAKMKDILNNRIKHRENFRPFAPSIIIEKVADFFVEKEPSPFMLLNYRVLPEKISLIPAVVHIDGTARVQTVDKKTNPKYWMLIKEFENITGIPIVLNTSFNENEPIVCTPEDAIRCFLNTKMDYLALEDFLIKNDK